VLFRSRTAAGNVNGLTFVEPAAVLPPIMAEARAKGAVCFIVLSHLGFDKDLELARQVPGIHLIVGGHSHTIVPDPVVAGETLVVQAGYYGLYLGALNLDIDPRTGRILDYPRKGVLQLIEPAYSMNRLPAFVEKYDKMVRREFNRVVGRAAVDLVRADAGESNIGNMISDAVRESTGADAALMNGGGIRADIPAGDITMEQVYTMEPFDNVVVTMDLTGAQLMEVLEESASGRHRLMQVSGLTVRYDAARPLGARVAAAAVAGKPIVSDRVYRVAAHDFLAAGGDHYVTFLHGKRVAYGEPLRDVILAYLKRHAPVSPRIEGRITVTGR
jgi:5'-nucleotidase/UDP-sugar diphosphatase